MSRIKELTFRAANAGLMASLGWLHRKFDVKTTYKIGRDGAAALFEDSWFAYSPREFGCTGNLDFRPDAENATRDAVFKRVRGEEVFYDVGAHGGVYTITLQKTFPRLTVHSFEPQPEDLLRNLQLNGLSAERVHRVAVGDKEGFVSMTSGKRSSNHVSEKGNRQVPMVRLDDLGLPLPQWIKIDIEGLELPALRGAERILREGKPTVICEINHLYGRFGTDIPQFIAYMESVGLKIHRLRSGELEPINNVSSFEDLGFSEDWNFWFLPR